ncbi:hypothetical protein B0H66DRAFT_267606 [Apodospora peruviana]|uniref:Uncharacterized protein n=1 Tax=Apodospora peruviana TaxID=516989 RepID=A0AAE0I6D3_9PEZI|nr:hypothetical protein B0H66DRAFT_267606 [Apodospora peruviana]
MLSDVQGQTSSGYRARRHPRPRKRRKLADEEPDVTMATETDPNTTNNTPVISAAESSKSLPSELNLSAPAQLRSTPPSPPDHTMEPSRTPEETAPPARRIPFFFLHFPSEIRNMIYEYALQWPTCRQLYAGYNRQINDFLRRRDLLAVDNNNEGHQPEERWPEYVQNFRTPTILLLCRQITSECLPMWHERRFVLDRLPPWPPGRARPMPVSDFIGRNTLQAMKRLEIRIQLGLGPQGSGWVWSDIACHLFGILWERNAFVHLQVVIVISYNPLGGWDTSEQEHLELIDTALVKLKKENPNVFNPGTIEREYWIVEGKRASRAVTNDKGELHAADDDSKAVHHPDPKIWPGSLLEFL